MAEVRDVLFWLLPLFKNVRRKTSLSAYLGYLEHDAAWEVSNAVAASLYMNNCSGIIVLTSAVAIIQDCWETLKLQWSMKKATTITVVEVENSGGPRATMLPDILQTKNEQQ